MVKILQRIKELGVMGTFERAQCRIQKKIFAYKWKKRALEGAAGHTWKQIATKHFLRKNFELFFEMCKQKDPIPHILSNKLFLNHVATTQQSREHKAVSSDASFFPARFYQEIRPCQQRIISMSQRNPDIKIPWEYSRFQHLFALGEKYQETNDESYGKKFMNQVSNWIKENNFLIGANWVCPMEVAIRAINWIWGFSFFKDSSAIPESFWEKFVGSLYDHAFYLEHNWETSDRPNNHYISDLVGYFYLCNFFSQIPQFQKARKKTIAKIIEQLDHQVLDDGTSYEGSTAYHMLDTELFWHTALLCEAKRITLPTHFKRTLQKMFNFLHDCTVNNNHLEHIGDDDSGIIVTGLKISPRRADKIKHYPHFGFTIIKQKQWHITFRHPTYQSFQPTGHFHHDILSVTCAINNIPVLVDPGSYVYTSNPLWRNLMRSYQMHNTFYKTTEQSVQKEIDLFQLPRKQRFNTTHPLEFQSSISIKGCYGKRRRTLILDKKTKHLIIEDTCDDITQQKQPEYCWTLIFHPDITMHMINGSSWLIEYQEKPLCTLESSLYFRKAQGITCSKGFYAPRYGTIQSCTKLFCSVNLRMLPQQTQTITLKPT